MKVLIKQARIICSSSSHHGTTKDILINEGIIEKIAINIDDSTAQKIEAPNIHVSIGWMDSFAQFSDPGFEHRETIKSGANAAAAGGFTDVMIVPNTNPVVDTKSQIEYIQQKSASLAVNVHVMGAVTKKTDGKELTEMYDMHQSGAIAFSDGLQPIQQSAILIKALQYVIANDTTIIQLPDDKSIAPYGLMNEGITSTKLGLPGKPAIAEELMIARDIELLRYTQSQLHITGVSTRKSIELIEKAKKEGLSISCSCTPYHCLFNEEDLIEYDTNLKVNPPLRSKEDMMAVRRALLNKSIDCIASHHIPLHTDDKICEFEYAKFGMIGLESLFGSINSFYENIYELIEQLSINPRRIFKTVMPKIEENVPACLTMFDPITNYTFENAHIKSTSKNSPFIGKELKGKVIGIVNKSRLVINALSM